MIESEFKPQFLEAGQFREARDLLLELASKFKNPQVLQLGQVFKFFIEFVSKPQFLEAGQLREARDLLIEF